MTSMLCRLVCVVLLSGITALAGGQQSSVICTDLPSLAIGDIDYGGAGSTNSRPEGTVARYTCDTGYTLNGGSTFRTCGSGVWSGFAPVCLLNCPDLLPLTNGMIMYNATAGSTVKNKTFSSTAVHSCNTGYTLTGGATTRVCVSGGRWNGSPPTCQKDTGPTCPDLPSLTNGMIMYSAGSPDNRPFITVVTYSCNPGYTLTSTGRDTTRICVSGGSWSGSAPTCQGPTEPPTTCPDLTVPANGMISYTMGTASLRPVGTMATYTCDTGYTLNGGSTRVCVTGWIWSGSTPTCQVDTGPTVAPSITCPDLTSMTNGMISYNTGNSPRSVDTVATYTCDTGYTLNGGTTTRTCRSDGMWSGSAPNCQGPCSDLPPLMNGDIAYTGGLADSRPINTIATYTCDNGYTLTGGSFRACPNDGTWSGTTPTCQLNTGPTEPPTTCPDLTVSTNGMITYNMGTVSLRPVGTMATYNCTTDYTLDGGSTRTCGSDGMWSGSAPTCLLAEITTSPPTATTATTGGDTGPTTAANNTGGVVAGVVLVLLILAAVIVVGIIVGVYFWRKLRGNQTKYTQSPSPRHAPPPRPIPYQASFKKSNGQDSKVTIEKVDEPSIVEFPSDTHVTEGEEVYLRVKVGGHPPPSITWYHDSRKVTADYATELDQDDGLSFPSVETKHAGVYKLVVTGASGSTTQQVVTVTVMSEGGEASEGVNYAPIPVTEFGAYVADLHAGTNKKFKDLYKNLDSGERGHPVIISVTPENKLNNRFGNIAVYDDNLIILDPIPGQEDCQSDYINACYVDGYKKPRRFIATQGPLPGTLVDFWRMMWQERPPIIVMLTNLMENNKIKCEQYWPESGKKQFGPFTVAITDQQILADYTMRTLEASLEGDRRVLRVKLFHFTAWPDHGVPDYATPILAFHRRVQTQHKPSKGPILIHCSAGVGRTGTYIAIDNVLDQIAVDSLIDISGTIVKSRNQRMKLVQTQDQYVFIHDAILESVTCGDTQISAGDLRRQILKMSLVSPGKIISDFQYQFQILEQVTPNPKEVQSPIAVKNAARNRNMDYLPPETSRVILKGEQPDYIHAVFAHGYKHQKAYIIAQNPLDSTVRNFWKVIYDRKCAAVVMLTPLSENGQEACSQYWPESGNVTSFGEFTIDNLGEETNTGFVMRQLSVLNEKTQKAHQLTQFHITNWKSSGKCENLKTVTDVNEEVIKVQRRTGNNPVLVHCNDTATRSGMYCSVGTTIDRCKTEGVVDVFQVVKALRVHKPGAVPSVDNYKDLFDATLVYLDSFDNYANFQDI